MARVVGAVAWASLALAACYSPTPIEGEACSETDRCPEGLICDPASLTCVSTLPEAARFTAIDVGWHHTCGLDADGAIWCWGSNAIGAIGTGDGRDRYEPVRVDGPDGWEQLSVGREGTCAIRTGGELWCWGTGNVTGLGDQSSPERLVVPATTWTAISVGYEGFCAIAGDGVLWCRWSDGMPSPPVETPTGDAALPIKSVSASNGTMCLIDNSDALWCWGTNDYGQAGSGTPPDPVATPMQIAIGTPWASVAVGQDHACAITTDGALYCWGECDFNQTGSGNNQPETCVVPERFGTDTYRSVDPGDEHTCAVRSDGALVCFGVGDDGELADLGGDRDTGPVIARGIDGFETVSSGYDHGCGLRAGGEAWCWGSNRWGQLGDGTGGARRSPERVHDGPWQTLSLGAHSSCGIRDDGSLWCWGKNPRGQLGDGTTFQRHRPVRVGPERDWIAIAAGVFHTCGIRSPGTLWCWGDNEDNQLGTGGPDVLTPQQVGSAEDWTAVTASESASCGLRGGALYCWGVGFDSLPTEIDGPTWSAIAATPLVSFGGCFQSAPMCGAKAGSMYCWNDPVTGAAIDAGGWMTLSVGWDHACGITATGAGAMCIGDNEFGQLGNGSAGGVVIPGVAVDGGPYAMIDAGDEASCGVTTAGQLKCWGLNDVNALGDENEGFVGEPNPTAVMPGTTWRTVDVAHDHGCAADSVGALWCWGDNRYGELGNGGGGSDRPVRVKPPEAGP
jgi:alpha-tubulin suppressor-like RCC1 family protein